MHVVLPTINLKTMRLKYKILKTFNREKGIS